MSKPTRRQIVLNWLMGEDDYGIRSDGWWATSEGIAAVDGLLAALDASHDSKSGTNELVVPDRYIQTVPDHCDRIVWRNRYFMLDDRKLGTELTEVPKPGGKVPGYMGDVNGPGCDPDTP